MAHETSHVVARDAVIGILGKFMGILNNGCLTVIGMGV